MDYTLTEEQSLLRDTARSYFAKTADPTASAGKSKKIWDDISSMGWLAITVPVECGGIGGSIVDGCLLAREFGRSRVTVPFAETAILGPLAFANQPEMLEKIAAGNAKLAFSLQDDEPLVYEASGSGYILRGTRSFTRCDADATVLVVKAINTNENSPALFACPIGSPSSKVTRFSTLDGVGAVGVTFEPTGLSSDTCLTSPMGNPDLFDTLKLYECLAFSAEAIGLMEFLVNTTREYTMTREQFGQPLTNFQVVRHKLVEMYAYSQLAESLVFQAADTLFRLGPVTEAVQAVRAAFSFVGRQGRRVGKEAIQLHGAIGTMDEVPVGHAFARLVAISQSCGGAASHERSYAREAIAVGDSSRLWAL
ncbi:pimeloyl-CoA dehydrogenase small subunit protein (plasmid) [Rhizobium gallicum]|uniref:Pimeloyl-CoA dehydrogenase small subunit protein n=1 Tax=Rhizobium gallicum TaxID=56730 RepID=A0A1L5NPI9_9HYPH|nr:acyl-CoA dehydrogenase family protein [Rhizobium gallicum]APO69804.1 pimeloyl-CoA dehydrogenase small subunit protein [Rhizobium gallicum]